VRRSAAVVDDPEVKIYANRNPGYCWVVSMTLSLAISFACFCYCSKIELRSNTKDTESLVWSCPPKHGTSVTHSHTDTQNLNVLM